MDHPFNGMPYLFQLFLLKLFLCFLPIGEELLQADVGQRMVEQHFEHTDGHGSHVGSGQGRLNHMHGMSQRCRQNLSGKIIIFVDLNDFSNQLDTVLRNVIQAAHKRTDISGPGLGR